MDKVKEESMITKYPNPILIEGIKTILKQMQNNVCKIYHPEGRKGTFFWGKGLLGCGLW